MKRLALGRSLPKALIIATILLLCLGGPAAASNHSTTTSTTAPATVQFPKGFKWVGVAQTVLVSANANGSLSSAKPLVFTQLSANGKGPVTVRVPMSSDGLRNLIGLGKPPVENGKAVWNLHLNGPTTERTVSKFPRDRLPLKVSATYKLNGKKVSAQDVVGKSGNLKVTYTVRNATSKATPVTYKNVFGETQRQVVQAPIPMAATVSVTLPDSFTNLQTPGATINGDGNGSTAATWTMFLFNPLGGVKQSVTYEAQVTNAVVPSATISGAALPAKSLKTLPTISEPSAPAVPTVTVGGHLANFQTKAQKDLQQIASRASNLLDAIRAVAVPGAQDVSAKAAQVSTSLGTLSANVGGLSTTAGSVSAQLSQHAAALAGLANTVSVVAGNLSTLPGGICTRLSQTPPFISVAPGSALTSDLVARALQAFGASAACAASLSASPSFRLLHFQVNVLENLLVQRSAAVATTAGDAANLQAFALNASSSLAAASGAANDLSASAAQQAISLAQATQSPARRHGRTIQPRQVGGGGHLDAAVAQLDAAIASVGNGVDNDYAHLTALDVRAFENQLPAGDASGATVEAGAVVYSVAGANSSQRAINLSVIIAILALMLGASAGLAVYRLFRGEFSSLAPPKKT